MGRIKTRYSQKEFLDYYKFEDEPEFTPQYFHRSYKFYENLLEEVPRAVRNGLKPRDAVMFHAGISQKTYSTWKRGFEKEIEDGKRDTPLCRLFLPIMKADGALYEHVMKNMMALVDEGDGESIRFMVRHRLGYSATNKQEVELSTDEDFSFNINIVDSKKREDDD